MQLTRWLGPALIALLAMLGYQILVSPWIADLREDWAFLHGARDAAIRQLQQQRPASQK